MRKKWLRVMRVLRSLRLVPMFEGTRQSLDAIIYSIPSIFEILLISLFFFVFFGMIAVNYFKGELYICDSSMSASLLNIDGLSLETKWDCLNIGGYYKKREVNFDGLGNSMAALFPIS